MLTETRYQCAVCVSFQGGPTVIIDGLHAQCPQPRSRDNDMLSNSFARVHLHVRAESKIH